MSALDAILAEERARKVAATVANDVAARIADEVSRTKVDPLVSAASDVIARAHEVAALAEAKAQAVADVAQVTASDVASDVAGRVAAERIVAEVSGYLTLHPPADGKAGADGRPGQTLVVGNGPPTFEGRRGDLYLQIERGPGNGDLWRRGRSGWSVIGNLQGPQGEPGVSGGRSFISRGGGGGAGGALGVKDEGVSLTAAATALDFTGAGVTATNVGGAVTVTIPAGAGTLAEVLTAGNDADGHAIIGLTTLTGVVDFDDPDPIEMLGMPGTGGDSGQHAVITGGGADGGGGAFIQASGGTPTEPGKLRIRTADLFGPGVLVSDGVNGSLTYARAAFVEPTTATPETIANALITAGLMAAS